MYFPPKEWILSRPTNSLWQNIEKHQSTVLLPVSPPSFQHTHFKRGTSSQLLQLLSSVIFVRAESRSNLNSITLTVICKSLTHSMLIQDSLTREEGEWNGGRRLPAQPEVSRPYIQSMSLPLGDSCWGSRSTTDAVPPRPQSHTLKGPWPQDKGHLDIWPRTRRASPQFWDCVRYQIFAQLLGMCGEGVKEVARKAK